MVNRVPAMSATTAHPVAGAVRTHAGQRREAAPVAAAGRTAPVAVAVDLGSGQARLWAVGHGVRIGPSVDGAWRRPTPLVRRGRIVDAAGCVSLLTQLLQPVVRAVPAGAVVVTR
jgi:hypothetical protein